MLFSGQSQGKFPEGAKMANYLPFEKKELILASLVEGSSIRSIEINSRYLHA